MLLWRHSIKTIRVFVREGSGLVGCCRTDAGSAKIKKHEEEGGKGSGGVARETDGQGKRGLERRWEGVLRVGMGFWCSRLRRIR